MSDKDEISVVARRPSLTNPKVSWGDPIEVHDSTKSRIEMVPLYIDRTKGTAARIKILRYEKSGPVSRLTAEVNLDDPATRRLHSELGRYLAVADDSDIGTYVVIRITDGVARVGDIAPEAVASAVASLLQQDTIVEHLAEQDLGYELVRALQGAIRLKELRNGLASLRRLLDEGADDESLYQRWCEDHSWAFGNAHVVNDTVRSIAIGDQVDLLLPSVLGGFRDLVELKRPSFKVLAWDNDHRNWFFAREVSRSIGQCHRYLDVLHEQAGRGLRDSPSIIAYHPRATVVIGRSHDWDEDRHRALHGLNRRLSSISIMTYDHLLAQGERMLSIVESESESELDLREPEPW